MDERVSSSSFVYCHISHPLTILQTAAAAATTADTAATDDDDDEGESAGNSEGEDDKDNEDLLSDMGPKKVPAPAAAAAAAPKKGAPAKSGNVDALANLLQGATSACNCIAQFLPWVDFHIKIVRHVMPEAMIFYILFCGR